MATSNTPPDGFSDSDQQWFDRVSGKVGTVNDAAVGREADALRLALEQQRQRLKGEADEAADEEAQARDWERLQFALKREGLLQPPRRPRWTWPALGGLAAALMLSAVLVPLWIDSDRAIYPEPPVLRGVPSVRQVASDQPRQSAERFAQALQQAGLAPVLYQQGKSFLVDMPLQPEQLEAATPAFMGLGLAPSTGLNRTVFSAQ